ncbi:MAG TPA: tetratricopeptide repeat protein [Pyrinomonadaceae bacterium]|nr:tetratricopeptide repeat protein [Pyrinomonadaceae bacterium]
MPELRAQIEAATTDSERIRLQLKLAEELVSTGQRSEALKELDAIAKSGAFDPPGFYNLGNSFARLGETESALSAYREAINQRRGKYSRAFNNMGVILLREGRWDEAYDAFIDALKIEKFHYAEASYNLGRLYAARGQKDLAAREWRRALTVDPQHDAAAQALANVGSEENIVVNDVKPIAVKSAAAKPEAKSAAPKPASASARGPRTLTLDQMSYDYLQRARNASERGKLTEAVTNFQQVLNRQGGYFAPANLELSYVLLTLKRYDEALGNLVAVSKRDGTRYPISYYHLARTYEAKGDLKNAEAAFTQAVNSYTPTNAQFLLDLIRVREKQGDYKGALESLERYLALVQQQGMKPSWSDQRLAELRAKVK